MTESITDNSASNFPALGRITEPSTDPIKSPPESLKPDYMYGARNIADFLQVSIRKVYHFMELHRAGKGHVPVHNRPGFGLCASKKALTEYLQGKR